MAKVKIGLADGQSVEVECDTDEVASVFKAISQTANAEADEDDEDHVDEFSRGDGHAACAEETLREGASVNAAYDPFDDFLAKWNANTSNRLRSQITAQAAEIEALKEEASALRIRLRDYSGSTFDNVSEYHWRAVITGFHDPGDLEELEEKRARIRELETEVSRLKDEVRHAWDKVPGDIQAANELAWKKNAALEAEVRGIRDALYRATEAFGKVWYPSSIDRDAGIARVPLTEFEKLKEALPMKWMTIRRV